MPVFNKFPLMGLLGSGVSVGASFQIFNFNKRGMSYVGREIVLAGYCPDGNAQQCEVA